MFCKYSMITFNGKNNGNYFDIIKKENIDIMVLKEYAIFLVFKKFTFIYYLWGGVSVCIWCTMCMPCSYRVQERVMDPLEL